MAVQIGDRSAILLGRDSDYPPHIAFYIAHELAHFALGHVQRGNIIVDLDSDALAGDDDPEENAADRFALQVLTGRERPVVLGSAAQPGARSLAEAAIKASVELAIEPGTLALCFGYSTKKWAVANAAMRYIYSAPKPVWQEVNQIALSQLALESVPYDSQSYVSAVLGLDANK